MNAWIDWFSTVRPHETRESALRLIASRVDAGFASIALIFLACLTIARFCESAKKQKAHLLAEKQMAQSGNSVLARLDTRSLEIVGSIVSENRWNCMPLRLILGKNGSAEDKR
jgi:hypothetical protein